MTWTTAIILLGMLAYAVIHSLLAGQNAKQYFRQRFGNLAYHGLYRIVYNIVATLTIAPIAALVVFDPGVVVWHVHSPWLVAALRLIQVLGVIGVAVSLLQSGLGQFSGIHQLQTYLSGKPLPLPPTPLRTDGVYRFVRHPLYFFSLLMLWSSPVMTSSMLAFTIGVTLYFVVGSRLEERHMVETYGAQYLDYQQRTPWLIPYLGRTHNLGVENRARMR